ncbi:hypothetical protein FRC17_002617, partial [Serendipita sp. 399]
MAGFRPWWGLIVNYSPGFHDAQQLERIKATLFNCNDDVEDPSEAPIGGFDDGTDTGHIDHLEDEDVAEAIEHVCRMDAESVREPRPNPIEEIPAMEQDTEMEIGDAIQASLPAVEEAVEAPSTNPTHSTRANVDGLDVIPPLDFGILTLSSFPNSPRIFVCLTCKHSFKSNRFVQLRDHRCHGETEMVEEVEADAEED